MPRSKLPPREQLLKAQVKLTQQNAALRELEVAQKRGNLIPKQELQAQLSSVLIELKTRLTSLPAKLSPQLAQMSDPSQIDNLLTSELYEILAEVANGN